MLSQLGKEGSQVMISGSGWRYLIAFGFLKMKNWLLVVALLPILLVVHRQAGLQIDRNVEARGSYNEMRPYYFE